MLSHNGEIQQWLIVKKRAFSLKVIWLHHIWSPDFRSPTSCPPGQTILIKSVPMDKWTPTNLVLIDKWSPKMWSPTNSVHLIPDPHNLSPWTNRIFLGPFVQADQISWGPYVHGDQIIWDHLSMWTELVGDYLSRGTNKLGDQMSMVHMRLGPNVSQPWLNRNFKLSPACSWP